MEYEASKILSRNEIREISKKFRRMFKIRTIRFPVIKVLDLMTFIFKENLYYHIEDDSNFESNVVAALIMEKNNYYCIKIRESVFQKAINGNRACLCYICHEMCHFFLIHVMGIGPKITHNNNFVYITKTIKQKAQAYRSMEWQAMALCGEVMIPYKRCINYDFDQIIKKPAVQMNKHYIS